MHTPSPPPHCVLEGGYGPKLESWAFGIDWTGLAALLRAGVFHLRTCKLCTGEDGIVVKGEYGLTSTLMKHGYNIGTLMSMYRGVRHAMNMLPAHIKSAPMHCALRNGARGSLGSWGESILIEPPLTHMVRRCSRSIGATSATGGATITCIPHAMALTRA